MEPEVTNAVVVDTARAAPADSWRTRALDRSPSVRKTQERVILQTRRLIDAAKDLYDDESVGSDFTVQQLVDRAGISLQTFYRYFKSKDDLLLGVYESTVQDAVDLLIDRYGHLTDPVERLHEYTVKALLATYTSHRGSFILTVNAEQIRLTKSFPVVVARAFEPYRRLLEQCIRDGLASGVMRSTESAELAAGVLATLIIGLYRDLSNIAVEEPTAHLQASWSFICAGLGVDEKARAASAAAASGRRPARASRTRKTAESTS